MREFKKTMSDITLRAIAKTMEDVLKQELEPVKTRLDSIEKLKVFTHRRLNSYLQGRKIGKKRSFPALSLLPALSR